jgi:hypothetical protein
MLKDGAQKILNLKKATKKKSNQLRSTRKTCGLSDGTGIDK